MSEPLTDKEFEQAAEYAAYRIERCLGRRARLVELGAPRCIILNETKMIRKWASDLIKIDATGEPRDRFFPQQTKTDLKLHDDDGD